MYKTMLVFSSPRLLEQIQAMRIWGRSSDFEIAAVINDGGEAYHELQCHKYDLVICQTKITGLDSVDLLRRAKREKLCGCIAFCSETPDFEYARKGIIYRAFDYFAAPFEESQFYSAFSRIKNKTNENKAVEIYHAEEILSMFERRDSGIYDYISDMINEICSNAPDAASAENILSQIYNTVVNEIFGRNEWLDLYKSSSSFYADGSGLGGTYNKCFINKLSELFNEYYELFPEVNNEKIQEVILYILNNPESDLKQKTIAAEHYINSSYLSTVFSTQTQVRFVDYLTTIKLKRAGWLLQNTALKVTEIAARLDYKDIGYFSRVFKRQYGVTPTEYRIPDDYTYQI
ncbi:MAG: DNA-binding response regulator [Candidatus Ornithomonoglobus sp.]